MTRTTMWLKLARLGVLVTLLVGVVGTLPVAAQGGYTPEIGWAECPFPTYGEVEGDTIDCGYLFVPQDRADVDGPWVELAFAILYATGPNPVPDPILYLEGGPGGSALSGVDAWLDSPFRTDRDIILFDQRGTGFSKPRLHCREQNEIEFDAANYDAANAAALAACAERLHTDDGVDVADYNSAASAADVRDLRVALAYDAWNLYGISYGTRLALTVIRDQPEGIRSVIIDAVYPPNVDAYEETVVTAYSAFRRLFDNCAADAACAAAFPDLEIRFYALVDTLNQNPLALDADESLWGDDLVNFMFDLFYTGATVPYMPLMIVELERGDTTTYLALADGTLPPPDTSSPALDDPVFAFVDEFNWLMDDLDDEAYLGLEDALYALYPLTYDGLSGIIVMTFADEDAEYLISLLDAIPDSDYDYLEIELFEGDVSDTDGAFNAVECYEEFPFNDMADAEALAANVPYQIAAPMLLSFSQQVIACDAFPTGTASSLENEAVVSDVPTLVLTGEYDPITPPAWGALAVETLANGIFFEFPGVGHGAIDGGDCPVSIGLAFLTEPTVVVDGSCIGGMARPPFALP